MGPRKKGGGFWERGDWEGKCEKRCSVFLYVSSHKTSNWGILDSFSNRNLYEWKGGRSQARHQLEEGGVGGKNALESNQRHR